MNIQTLHSHTTNSDGLHSHREVLNLCDKYGISVVAFTDHDIPMPKKIFNDLKNSAAKAKWVSGIEISSGLPKELGGGSVSNFHIVGLFIDPKNKKLNEYSKLALQARIERMQKMVKNLNSLGFKLNEYDCIKASGGEAVGRPHIVNALGEYPENAVTMQNLVEKMKEESQTDSDIKDQYDKMIERGKEQYPYVLFLSEDSFIKDIYVDYQYWTDMDSSVELIRNAGGVAMIAHYWTIQTKIDLNMIEQFLTTRRIDGMETVFGLEAYGTNFEKEIDTLRSQLENLVSETNSLRSGGSDAHKEDHFEKFANSNFYSERTEGMAEEILKNSQCNKQFSNLL